jgi:hypothetical protein
MSFKSRLHLKTFAFKTQKLLPYDANFGVPGPDAGYFADGLEPADCPHWERPPEAHCLGSATNKPLHSHEEHISHNDYLVIHAAHEGTTLVASQYILATTPMTRTTTTGRLFLHQCLSQNLWQEVS